MRNSILVLTLVCVNLSLHAQKIIPITIKGEKYELADLSSKGTQMWGGYEEIPLHAASSESNGALNTKAIVATVGENKDYDNKPYAAKTCTDLKLGGKQGWYLPSQEEATAIFGFRDKLSIDEKASIWTSTESAGTQAYTLYWYNGSFYKSQKVDPFTVVCLRKQD
ncbi:MAG: hypothetical protein IPQ08_13595 [Chitinophagaceae bacterium]|jgi:hypothetical protein|nr:hypothetical protein [Chitinophagaceae bacterium]